MSKGLDAWKLFLDDVEQCVQSGGIHYINHKNKEIIENELKDLDKIKARLTVVKMKLASKREECSQNMQHTDEEDFVHDASIIEMRCLDWFRDMINEVLL